jgi:hypothetical protein
MKYQLLALFIGIFLFSYSQITPEGYTIMEEITGDLNKDSIPEKVIAYNTNHNTDFGTIREIHIFKKTNDNWVLWKKSENAIRKSEEGGTMGDPYGFIQIKKGILIIGHAGGSNWKWSYQDKYRFQNGEFELIGYSSEDGSYCQYFNYIDFNISTGKYNYKKTTYACDENGNDEKISKTEVETCTKKGIKLNLSNRNIKPITIKTVKYKYVFSL